MDTLYFIASSVDICVEYTVNSSPSRNVKALDSICILTLQLKTVPAECSSYRKVRFSKDGLRDESFEHMVLSVSSVFMELNAVM